MSFHRDPVILLKKLQAAPKVWVLFCILFYFSSITINSRIIRIIFKVRIPRASITQRVYFQLWNGLRLLFFLLNVIFGTFPQFFDKSPQAPNDKFFFMLTLKRGSDKKRTTDGKIFYISRS
jgi:hypothetical protein